MERKCRYVPLSKQPLVLVLGQVPAAGSPCR
jgi:hypothetical protein